MHDGPESRILGRAFLASGNRNRMSAESAWDRVRWLPRTRVTAATVRGPLRDWLCDPGSLTRRLQRASGGDFRVRVLRQVWARPGPAEALLLGMDPRELCLVREVTLVCRGEPWVYARSLLPEKSLRGPLRFLRRLDARPLGALLFRDPTMRRGAQQFARVPAAAIPVADVEAPAWGRRCTFYLRGRPLLVAEVFLPAMAAVSAGPG